MGWYPSYSPQIMAQCNDQWWCRIVYIDITRVGPVLFSKFIRPVYDVKNVTTYADDNYLGEADGDVLAAMNRVIRRMEILHTCYTLPQAIK